MRNLKIEENKASKFAALVSKAFFCLGVSLTVCPYCFAQSAKSFRPTISGPRNNAEVRMPFTFKLAPLPSSVKNIQSVSLLVDNQAIKSYRGFPSSIQVRSGLTLGSHTFSISARNTTGHVFSGGKIKLSVIPARVSPTPTATATPGADRLPSLGANSNLNGYLPFPASNAWNTAIDSAALQPAQLLPAYLYSSAPLHPDFGGDGEYGIPINVVDNATAKFTIPFDIPNESDAGPYPIARSMKVEGGWVTADDGNDHHLLVLNRDSGKLYEIYNIRNPSSGVYSGYSGAVFDTKSNAQRPLYWTSSDAAGLAIFPALLKYEEVAAGSVDHALRFTLQNTYNGFVPPARHAAGYSNTQLAPMGMRVRLKASVNISHLGTQAKVIATAMKKYGMILADNGSNWFFQGTNDPRWNDDDLNTLKSLHGSDFEVIQMPAATPQQ